MTSKAAEFVTGFNTGLLTESRPFTLLFATDKDGVIGDAQSCNGLPWKCKPDLERFRDLTLGNVIVLGAKSYLQLVRSWPSKVVLKARDVIVVHGVNDGQAEVEESERKLRLAAEASGKIIGSSLNFLPAPRSMLTSAYTQPRMLHRYQDALAADIAALTKEGQRVYIAGGAAMIELLYEKCAHADMTVITHGCKVKERVYLGPKAQQLLVGLRDKLRGQYDAVDEEHKTAANFYFLAT